MRGKMARRTIKYLLNTLLLASYIILFQSFFCLWLTGKYVLHLWDKTKKENYYLLQLQFQMNKTYHNTKDLNSIDIWNFAPFGCFCCESSYLRNLGQKAFLFVYKTPEKKKTRTAGASVGGDGNTKLRCEGYIKLILFPRKYINDDYQLRSDSLKLHLAIPTTNF
jgi:hypothetical protein